MRAVFVNDNGYIGLLWLYKPTLVIRSINPNKYYIKRSNSLMILSIYKEEVDHLYIKSIVNNLIKNGVRECLEVGRSKTDRLK